MKKLIGVFVVFGLLTMISLPLTAAEDDVESQLAAALDFHKKGKNEEAIKAVASVLMVLENKRELAINDIQLCDAINGYDNYQKKPSNKIKAGETIWLYCEVRGYGVEKEGGRYLIWISEDAKLVNKEGKVLYQQDGIFDYKKAFDVPILPIFIPNKLANLPPDKYTYQFTVKDNIKKSFVTRSVEFEVEAEESKSDNKK